MSGVKWVKVNRDLNEGDIGRLIKRPDTGHQGIIEKISFNNDEDKYFFQFKGSGGHRSISNSHGSWYMAEPRGLALLSATEKRIKESTNG